MIQLIYECTADGTLVFHWWHVLIIGASAWLFGYSIGRWDGARRYLQSQLVFGDRLKRYGLALAETLDLNTRVNEALVAREIDRAAKLITERIAKIRVTANEDPDT